MKSARHNAVAGMTLVEVCVSLAIAAFATLVLMGVLGMTLGGARQASDESTAALIQQRLLADLHSQPFNSIQLSDAGSVSFSLAVVNTNLTVDYDQRGEPSASAAYFRALLSTRPSANLTDLSAVTVSVVWPIGTSRPNTNTINTWVARRQ